MAQLAQDTGIAREALYRALSNAGNPELGTALKVMHALGVRLSASLEA
jgi:probable addiction module antidote protein